MTQRLRDSNDTQDCRCDGVCINNSPPKDATTCREGSIKRLADTRAEGDGVMEMKTQATSRQPASSVAAKGSFARAGDEDITVIFEYLFREVTAGTKVNVYLSDKQNVGERIFKVATFYPPSANSPGGTGSAQCALFQGRYPHAVPGVYDLNFVRGTYIELELVADEAGGTRSPASATVWIDNFDPRVYCLKCASFDNISTVDKRDYLTLLAETGQALPENKWCLDLSNDGYVDLADSLMWGAIRNSNIYNCPNWEVLTASATKTTQKTAGVAQSAALSGQFVIGGKSSSASDPSDKVYSVDGTTASAGQMLACPVGVDCAWGLARLVKDANNTIYVVNGAQGIVRQDTGERIVAPGAVTLENRTVVVGLQSETSGVPLSDAAFAVDDTKPAYVYVVPVEVQASGHTYKAAAKLHLLGGGAWEVAALYGMDPYDSAVRAQYPCYNCDGCTPNCDTTGMREIELDESGHIFVAASSGFNGNDWILVFNQASVNLGHEAARFQLTSLFPSGSGLLPASPAAMLVSTVTPGKLYLAGQGNSSGGTLTHVHRFTIGADASSMAWDGLVSIDASAALPSVYTTESACTGVVAQVTAIQESSKGLHVIGMTVPRFSDSQVLPLTVQGVFTKPVLATVPSEAVWSVDSASASTVAATEIMGSDLALPVSAVYVASESSPADFNSDGYVDAADMVIFAACATGPAVAYNAGSLPAECTPMQVNGGAIAADFDADGDVDSSDFAHLQRCANNSGFSDAGCSN